ncbi:MAG: glycoside hydrolase family 88 protein, partial [Bacteroidetes bacterium]|nr:glycoside hydrolase family 88 protein [Bacteroidota bacterium]
MRRKLIFSLLISATIFLLSCQNQSKEKAVSFIEGNVKFAVEQYGLQTAIIEENAKVLNPKSFIDGKMKYIKPQEWTSGFFPGSMWYLNELTGDEKWKTLGIKYTEALDQVQYLTNLHDVGFMIGCSYGNGLRLSGNEEYKQVIVQAAKSLSTRFRTDAGVIQSWNVTGGWQAQRGWECPVIIDNMMNLELLFDASQYSGDSTFYKIAVTHADNTIKNHFRPDFSTWHVIDYSLADGSVRNKHTAQGFAHESTWARGQSWAVYGYT